MFHHILEFPRLVVLIINFNWSTSIPQKLCSRNNATQNKDDEKLSLNSHAYWDTLQPLKRRIQTIPQYNTHQRTKPLKGL